MKTLSEYLVSAFIATLIAGVGEKIAPRSMRRYVTFISSLLLLVLLFSPIKSLGGEIFDFTDNIFDNTQSEDDREESSQRVITIVKEKTEEAIENKINQAFQIDGTFRISLDMTFEESGSVLITQITLDLKKTNDDIANDIQTYLEETFHTKTTVRFFDA